MVAGRMWLVVLIGIRTRPKGFANIGTIKNVAKQYRRRKVVNFTKLASHLLFVFSLIHLKVVVFMRYIIPPVWVRMERIRKAMNLLNIFINCIGKILNLR